MTWAAETGASTTAQYSLKDGATPRTNPAAVDQTQPPADDQADGAYWKHLGVFLCQSGTLYVSLASNTNGNVLAGAVRLVQEQTTAPATNLAMNSFGVDSNKNLAVTYTITGATPPPFSIGIYQSSDGKQAGNLVGTNDVWYNADNTVAIFADTPAVSRGWTRNNKTGEPTYSSLGAQFYPADFRWKFLFQATQKAAVGAWKKGDLVAAMVYDVTLKLPEHRGYTDTELAAGGNVEVSAKQIGDPYVKK